MNRNNEGTRVGLVTIIAGIVSHLPEDKVEAPEGAWHAAFQKLQSRYSAEIPELLQLEFLEKPGVRPVSEDLERALQILGGATWNPRLLVRVFNASDKERMKAVAMRKLHHREEILQRAGVDLFKMLQNV